MKTVSTPIDLLKLRDDLANTPIPKWLDEEGYTPSSSEELDVYSTCWQKLCLHIKASNHAADEASCVIPYNKHWNWKTRDKAVDFKFINPVHTNRAGYKFLKCIELDIDRRVTQHEFDNYCFNWVIYDDISGHSHVGWILDEWTPEEEVKKVRKSLKQQLGSDPSQNNTIIMSPFYNTATRRDRKKQRKIIELFTKDGKLRRDFLFTKLNLDHVFSLEDIKTCCEELSPSLDHIEWETQEIVLKRDTTKTTQELEHVEYLISCSSLPIGCRNDGMFHRTRLEVKSYVGSDYFTYDYVYEVALTHSSNLPLCEVKATALSIYGYYTSNYDQGKSRMDNTLSQYASEFKQYCYRRDIGETLNDFASRIGISYSMAKKHSREKKLYRHEGLYYFRNNQISTHIDNNHIVSEPVKPTIREIEVKPYDRDGYHDNGYFPDFAIIDPEEVIIKPPIPIPRLLQELSAIELVQLWG